MGLWALFGWGLNGDEIGYQLDLYFNQAKIEKKNLIRFLYVEQILLFFDMTQVYKQVFQ